MQVTCQSEFGWRDSGDARARERAGLVVLPGE